MGKQNKATLHLLKVKSDDPNLVDKIAKLFEAISGRPATEKEKQEGRDILAKKKS